MPKSLFCPSVSIIALAYGLPSEELKRPRVRTDSFFKYKANKTNQGSFPHRPFSSGNYARRPVSNTDPNIHIDTVISSKGKNSNSQEREQESIASFSIGGRRGGWCYNTYKRKLRPTPALLQCHPFSPLQKRERVRVVPISRVIPNCII